VVCGGDAQLGDCRSAVFAAEGAARLEAQPGAARVSCVRAGNRVSFLFCSDGDAAKSPACTDGAARAAPPLAGPSSRFAARTSPRRRSATWRATPRSVRDEEQAELEFAPQTSRRSRICFCTVYIERVVGSSAISNLGPAAKAMAIIARWREPPKLVGKLFGPHRRLGTDAWLRASRTRRRTGL